MFARTIAAVRNFIIGHKIWSTLIAVVLLGASWWMWTSAHSTTGQTRYVLGTVQTSTLVSAVSESGQVVANQTLNLTPQVSGQIIGIYVKPGQTVRAGQAIATIDPTTALQQVQSAKESVLSAGLTLQKLQQPATTLTITQQQNAISQAEQSLATQYQSSYSDVTSTFLDLPAIITSIQNIDLGTDASNANSQWNIDYYKGQAEKYNSTAVQYRDAAYNDYMTARAAYDKTFAEFKNVSSSPDTATTEKILKDTRETTALVANAAKSAYDLIQFYSDQLTQNGAAPKALAATQITNLNTYQTKLQSHLTSLLGDQNTLSNNKQSITEKQQTLAETQKGADNIDVQQTQLTLQKAQEALDQAQQNLSKYYITAPFGGTISAVPVNKFDQASSGTTLATLITTDQYAALSVNEVDAAKIQVGQKATLTFDAIPTLTLTGTVVQVNSVGTVTQGVVSYEVRISFDAQNSQVKSGMTVTANIQSAVHQNVLAVPSSAVKTQGGQKYVLVFDPPLASTTAVTPGVTGILSPVAPKQVPVEVGISDDTSTEILSGLQDGEQIVTRSVTGATTAQTTTTAGAGGNRNAGFGGPVRIGG